MIISVASGKGGTGKTTVATSLAISIGNSCYIDCDVEEPNGHILLGPTIKNIQTVYKSVPEINSQLCTSCGKCAEVCEFNALINIKFEKIIIEDICHSCGACQYFCPYSALVEKQIEVGELRKGITENGVLFIDGVLRIGESSAVPLIKKVIQESQPNVTNILDSPPGTSCSMIEVVKDSDYCVLVTESTPYGLNDLVLAVNVLKTFNIPFGVIINKYDESFQDDMEYLIANDVDVLMTIPFNRGIAEAYSEGRILIEYDNFAKSKFKELFKKIGSIVKLNGVEIA